MGLSPGTGLESGTTGSKIRVRSNEKEGREKKEWWMAEGRQWDSEREVEKLLRHDGAVVGVGRRGLRKKSR